MSEETRSVPWPGWKVVRLIGRGGYGSVYEIERNQYGISERAAMKVVTIPKDSTAVAADRSDGYDDASIKRKYEECLQELIGEYKIMLQLKGNSNIVDCEDIYCEEHTNEIGWDLYIRMELLTPLKDRLTGGMITEAEVIRLGRDICRALSVCEDKNIIHRDVKPENIMVSDYGYKLGDFGVARSLDHTTNATVTGTERYMAPEIVRREKYGRDVDTYSLGLVLYWLLNDRRMPFWPAGTNPPKMSEISEAQYKRIHGEALPPPAHGSAALKRIVLRACAYNRNDRYGSAAEMLTDLESLNAEPENQKKAGSAPGRTFSGTETAQSSANSGDTAQTAGYARNANASETVGPGWRDAQETVGKPIGKKKPKTKKGAPADDTQETVGKVGGTLRTGQKAGEDVFSAFFGTNINAATFEMNDAWIKGTFSGREHNGRGKIELNAQGIGTQIIIDYRRVWTPGIFIIFFAIATGLLLPLIPILGILALFAEFISFISCASAILVMDQNNKNYERIKSSMSSEPITMIPYSDIFSCEVRIKKGRLPVIIVQLKSGTLYFRPYGAADVNNCNLFCTVIKQRAHI